MSLILEILHLDTIRSVRLKRPAVRQGRASCVTAGPAEYFPHKAEGRDFLGFERSTVQQRS